MKIKNGFRKVVSVVLAGAMAVGLAVTGGSSFGPKTVEAAAVSDYTTVNNVNFSSILGRGVNYGIISKQLEQICHMETTYATNYLINKVPPMNTDVDLAGYDTAYFIIADIAPDSMARFGYTYGKKVTPQIGQLQKMNYYIETTPEAKASQFTFDGDSFYGDPLYRVYDKQTLTDNVNKMINDALDASTALSNGSSVDLNVVGSTTIPNEAPYSGRSYILDLSASEYDNATVYVDVEQGSALEKAIQESGQLIVKKKSNTTVVFNVKKTGNFTLGKYAVEVTDYNPATYDGQFDRTIVGNSATVEDYSGGKLVISSDTDHSGNDTLHNQLVDMELCQKIIWNVEKADNVEFKETAGTFILAKSGNNSDVKGSSAGWIVSNGNVKVSSGEWHYVYHGRSSDINTEDTAQFHFAAKKAFTNTNPTSVSYDDSKKDVKEYKDGNNHVTASVESFENQINALDNVYAEKGAYKFSFTETSDSQFSTPIGTTTEVSTDKYGKLTFPSISYQVNEIDPLNPVTRYFIIREKAFDSNLVNDTNVSLLGTTGAVVTMAVTARSVEGIIYYTVDAKKYLTEADYTAGKCINHEWVETISGIEFSLGNLFNGYDLKTANLSITKDASVTDNADSADFASKYGNQEYEVALKKGNQYVHVQNDGSAVLGGEPYYIKVKSGHTVNISGLIPGDYVITEKTTDLIGYNLTTQSIKVGNTNTTDGSFTLAGNDNKAAEITNKYTKIDIAGKYKLNVRKTVEGLTGKTFHIAVAACDESGSPRAYVKNINGDFTDGNQEKDIVWFDINSGESISFAGLPKTYVDGNTNNYTYKVLEKYSDDKVKGYDWTPEGFNGNSEYDNFRSSSLISFNNDDEAKFEVKNKFEPKKGSLKISKAFKDSSNTDISFESGADLSGIKFTISGEGLTTSIEKVYNSTNFPNGVCTIDNLPYGSYTVTESGMNSVNSTYIYSSTQCGIDTLVDGTTGTVEVGDSGTKELKFVNYYDTPGSLTITKSVSGLDPADNKTNFKVAVINSAGKYISYTDENTWTYSDSPVYISLSTAGSLKINNLPVGEYTIVEDKDDAAVGGYTLAVSGEKPNGKNTYTVSKGTNTYVAIENTYTKIEYGITITKKVLGTPPYSDTEYEIAIKNSGGAYLQSLDGKNFSSTPKYFDLSNGAKISAAVNEAGTYTIEERLAGKTVNTHYDLVTEIGGTAGTVDTTNKVVTGTVVLDDQNKKKDIEVTNTYSRIDQTASVTLVKTNIGGTAKLGGAVFSIAVKSGASGSVNNLTFTGTESGATASSFTTVDSKDVVIGGLTDGTYVITEKKAPQDYDLLDHGIEFTVSNGVVSGTVAEIGSSNTITVVNSASVKMTSVDISKKALSTAGDELKGAKLTLTGTLADGTTAATFATTDVTPGTEATGISVSDDKKTLSFTSGTSSTKISNLKDGTYTLTETEAPSGYVKATAITFTIENGVVTGTSVTAAHDNVDALVTMVDAAKTTNVDISKKALSTAGDELKGAKLTLTGTLADGTTAATFATTDVTPGTEATGISVSDDKKTLSFTSGTSSTKISNLKDGTYTLTETEAPSGYVKATAITFTIENGVVTGTSVTAAHDNVDALVTMVDAAETVNTAKVDISKKALSTAGDELKGAKLTLTGTLADGTTAATFATTDVTPGTEATGISVSDDKKTLSFTSGTSSTKISNLKDGTYTLTETEAPSGYVKATAITFTIENGVVTGTSVTAAHDNVDALVTMVDAAETVKTAKVDISKKALSTAGDELKGAKLTLTGTLADGTTAATFATADVTPGTEATGISVSSDKKTLSFTSGTSSTKISNLKDGTYTLTETEAPSGYVKATAITFTIENGVVTGTSVTAAHDNVDALVTMVDAAETVNTAKVDISKKALSTAGDELKGAKLTLTGTLADGTTAATFATTDVTPGTEATGISVSDDKKTLSFTSGTSSTKISNLKDGTYTLTETEAPSGYVKATAITFTIENGVVTGTSVTAAHDNVDALVTMVDAAETVNTAKVDISKKALSTAGDELKGAKLTLTGTLADGTTAATFATTDVTPGTEATGISVSDDKKTLSFTSGTSSTKISNLKDGTYTLTETEAPSGYVKATAITFTIENGVVTGTSVTAAHDNVDALVTMVDAAETVNTAKVDISKKALSTAGDELKGAKLTLTGTLADGTTAATFATADVTPGTEATGISVSSDKKTLSFTSGTSSTKISNLKDGTYTLTETEAPSGYVKATAITFTIENGVVTGTSVTAAHDNVDALVTMVDAAETVNTAKVDISKKALSTAGDELKGAKLTLTGTLADGTTAATFATTDVTPGTEATGISVSDDKKTLSFTSGTSSTKISNLKDGTYTLTETEAPSGYVKATAITFTIENGVVTGTSVTAAHDNVDALVTMVDAALTGKLVITKTVNSPLTEAEYNGKLYFVISKYEGQNTTGYIQDTNGSLDATNAKKFTIVDNFNKTAEVDNGDGTTTRTYELVINNVPAGNYKVTETNDTIDGYELTKSITPNSVTIDNNSTTGSFDITDTYTVNPNPSGKIYITKNDAINMKELENAHIVVTKADGTPVDEWDTTTTAHELSVEQGNYIMTETGAPDGYQKVTTNIAFSVTIDASGKVSVNCTDTNVKIDDQDASKLALLNQPYKGSLKLTKTLKGAVTDEDRKGLSFTVTGPYNYNKTFALGTDFIPNSDKTYYELVLNDMPVGDYNVTETLTKTDGTTCTVTYKINNGEVKSGTSSTATVTNGNTTTVDYENNYTKNVYEVKISKVDATNKKEIAGAQLELYAIDANGNQIAGGYDKKWTSTTSVQTFTDITAGDYAIRELVAPEGYEKVETLFKFRVSFDANGKATVTSLGTDLPGSYDSQTDLITFENDPIKVDTATGGMIVTVEEEGTKRRVPNATVEIEAPSGVKFPDGSTKLTLTTDDNGQITGYKDKDGKTIDLTTGLIPGDYKVTVTKVPDGYKVTTGKTDTVTVKPGEVTEHLALIGTGENTTEKTTEKPTETTTEKKPSDTPSTEVKQPDTTTTPNAPGTPNKDKTVVDTGDRVNVVPVMIVMIISIIGIIFIISRKRKMRYEY